MEGEPFSGEQSSSTSFSPRPPSDLLHPPENPKSRAYSPLRFLNAPAQQTRSNLLKPAFSSSLPATSFSSHLPRTIISNVRSSAIPTLSNAAAYSPSSDAGLSAVRSVARREGQSAEGGPREGSDAGARKAAMSASSARSCVSAEASVGEAEEDGGRVVCCGEPSRVGVGATSGRGARGTALGPQTGPSGVGGVSRSARERAPREAHAGAGSG